MFVVETIAKIRRAFVAEPGHVLLAADYSQIELRLLAHMADIPELRKAFEDGIDIHAATASAMRAAGHIEIGRASCRERV